ncbi:hypothetical protein NKK48_01130 [Mesorhizobium sp. C386A]|uniref:hypothetical protein n=1 Tax=Mesorhizobium sp. C386A TaxID=2956831 RepID=UPI00333AA067
MLQGCTHLIPVETRISFNQDMLDADYAEYLENEWEGQMKRLDAAYEQKRSAHLQKRKEFQDAEFKIVEVVEGQGNCRLRQAPHGPAAGRAYLRRRHRGHQDFCGSC